MSGKKKWHIAAVGCYRNGKFYLHSPVLDRHYSIKVDGWMELPMTISTEMTAEIIEKMGARERNESKNNENSGNSNYQ